LRLNAWRTLLLLVERARTYDRPILSNAWHRQVHISYCAVVGGGYNRRERRGERACGANDLRSLAQTDQAVHCCQLPLSASCVCRLQSRAKPGLTRLAWNAESTSPRARSWIVGLGLFEFAVKCLAIDLQNGGGLALVAVDRSQDRANVLALDHSNSQVRGRKYVMGRGNDVMLSSANRPTR